MGASTASTASTLSMKIRGGGVCVDNEGNFYSPRSVVVAAAPPQQEEQERSQQPSLAADHRRTTILASSKSSASHSSSSSSSKTIVPASSGSKQGQLGLGRRKTTSFSPFFQSPPPMRGGSSPTSPTAVGQLLPSKIQHRIGDLCVGKEGNLYSSLSSLRGGGTGNGGGLCVDNEGNFYSSPSR